MDEFRRRQPRPVGGGAAVADVHRALPAPQHPRWRDVFYREDVEEPIIGFEAGTLSPSGRERAKLLEVPSGRRPSTCPVPASACETAPAVPSPPAATTSTGAGTRAASSPGKLTDMPHVKLRGHGHAEPAHFPARGGVIATARDPGAGDQHRLGEQRGPPGTARRARRGDGQTDRGTDGAARRHVGAVVHAGTHPRAGHGPGKRPQQRSEDGHVAAGRRGERERGRRMTGGKREQARAGNQRLRVARPVPAECRLQQAVGHRRGDRDSGQPAGGTAPGPPTARRERGADRDPQHRVIRCAAHSVRRRTRQADGTATRGAVGPPGCRSSALLHPQRRTLPGLETFVPLPVADPPGKPDPHP